MKYSKAGIIKKKIGPTSDLLQEEAKRMEEKLSELKEFMSKEKEKREAAPKMKDGSKWRSSAANKPISGYADLVLSKKGKISAKPKPSKKEDFLPTTILLNQVPEEKPAQINLIPQDEVLDFLNTCGMDKYYKTFIDNGIEEVDILMELTEGHLTNMGIPLGHRLKILKKIKESKGNDKKGKENNQPGLKTVEFNKGQVESATHEMCVGDDGPLPDGDFNEKESYNMFKEAIEHYRKAGSPTMHKVKAKSTEEAPKKVRFFEHVTEEMLPKDVKGLLYEGSWAPPESIVTETFEESSATNAAVLLKERKSCWNCYKIFEASSVFKAYDKDFCGKNCSDSFFDSRSSLCGCGSKFVKTLGILYKGNWVCSQNCVELIKKESHGELEAIEKQEEFKDEENIEESEDSQEVFDIGVCIDPATGDPVLKSN